MVKARRVTNPSFSIWLGIFLVAISAALIALAVVGGWKGQIPLGKVLPAGRIRKKTKRVRKRRTYSIGENMIRSPTSATSHKLKNLDENSSSNSKSSRMRQLQMQLAKWKESTRVQEQLGIVSSGSWNPSDR